MCPGQWHCKRKTQNEECEWLRVSSVHLNRGMKESIVQFSGPAASVSLSLFTSNFGMQVMPLSPVNVPSSALRLSPFISIEPQEAVRPSLALQVQLSSCPLFSLFSRPRPSLSELALDVSLLQMGRKAQSKVCGVSLTSVQLCHKVPKESSAKRNNCSTTSTP